MEMIKNKKIVLIGPVYPYKGGISHYTSMLYRTLAKKYEIELISYKMQYPRFLFKKEQKDFTNDMFKVEESKFLMHTANPFNIVSVGKYIRKERPDLVIIQWWHPYFAPCYWLLENVLGKKINKLFICHNVFPHERFPLDRFLTERVIKKGDFFIAHSKSDAKELMQIMPNAQYKINPIPTYNAFKVKNLTKEQARIELHKSHDMMQLLFFGFVREYKGLKYLLRAMPEVKTKLGKVNLMVVGSFANDKDDYMRLIKDMHIEDCVEVIDEYIPDSEVEKYFAACDLVVLPYESATQSAIVQVAYGFDKPVVATNVGGLPDVVLDGKTGYMVEAGKPELLAEAIVDYFVEKREKEMCEFVRQEAYRFDWERLREKIEELVGWQSDKKELENI